jgi:hypothetical protein
MGRLRVKPGNFARQSQLNSDFFSHVHRAQVTDVHVLDGTVNAMIESTDLVITVLAPLMALSLPPKTSQTDNNGGRAAWAKYIPQVGDLILVGFDTNGEPYSLGYHAVFYKSLEMKDVEKDAVGGIGWGETSGVKLEPGDFDFYSKRNARLSLTDKALLSSGPHTLVLNQAKGDATLTSTLSIVQYGEASEHRQGGVRRFLLPTDSEETDIYGIFGSVAQESTDKVSRALAGVPGGIEMCRVSMGEVIDELTFLPMVPVVTYPDLSTLTGTGTRIFRSVKDPSGQTELYSELIDDLGNYGVSAMTAIGFQWFTPASTWTVLNAVTSWTTSGVVDLTAGGDMSITAANASITAGQLALGAVAASEFLVKGTSFIGALGPMLTTAAATFGAMATACVGPLAPLAASFTTLQTAFTTLNSQLSTMLSTVVKTV